MEALFILAGLFFLLVVPVLAIRANLKLGALEREIAEFYWNFKITTDLLELRNLCTVAGLIVDSALLRRESRGLHYTLDYPDSDPQLCRNTVLRRS